MKQAKPKRSPRSGMTGDMLRAWREQLGWTQEDAAERLKTPVGTYRRWEQGSRRVPGIAEVATALLTERCKAGQSNLKEAA